MKTRIATAISVVGVLSAGSAAALVNTQILDSGPTESAASAAVLPPASTVDVTVPEITAEELLAATTTGNTVASADDRSSGTTVPEPPAPPTSAAPATPAAPESSDFLTAFNVGEAGVVTVDVLDGQLVLVKADAKPGWNVTETEEDDDEVEVDFRSDTVRVTFEAEFVDGQIVPKVTSKSIGGGSAPKAPTPATAPSTTIDDHHDDDYDDDYDDESDYEDDDYEDDDHEDDDHEDDERDDD